MSKLSPISGNKQNLQVAFTILLFVFANHGLVLLNDGIYWDDWINYIALVDQDWEKLFFVYYKAGGIPLSAYVNWIFAYAPNIIFAYRLTAVICILVSTLFLYWIGRHRLDLPKSVALLSVIVALSYPAFQMSTTIVGTILWIYYSLFLAGVSLALISFDLQGKKFYFSRIVALALLFFSYRFESLLLLSYSIIFIDLFSKIKNEKGRQNFSLRIFLIKRVDLLALPVVYWFFSRTFFIAPLNENYNRFIFESSGPLISGFINDTIVQQFVRVINGFEQIWPIALIFLGLSFVASKRISLIKTSDINWQWGSLLVLALILLCLVVIPSSLVGKDTSPIGYGTRHAIALGWPMGLVVVVGASMLIKRFPVLRMPLNFALFSLLFGFVVSNAFTYLTWQARWAKDQSVMSQLANIPGANNYSVYLIEDEYPIPGLEAYRFYEWAGIFRLVWGDESRVGFQEGISAPEVLMNEPPLYKKHFNTEDVNINGCYARLRIRQSLNLPYAEIGLRYIIYRIFFPEKLLPFLSVVTEVNVRAIDYPLETECDE